MTANAASPTTGESRGSPLISLIVAVSDDQVIGRNNALPWRLSADLRYFKKRTMGKPIVMGRKTWASIGRALPGRLNIVVTRDPTFEAEGATVVHSLDAAIDAAGDVDEIMIIGGETIYRSLLPSADRVYLTRVHVQVPDGDAHFPELDDGDWVQRCACQLPGENGQPDCTFTEWERRR